MEDSAEKKLPVGYTSEFEYSDASSECAEPKKESKGKGFNKELYKKPKTIKSSLATQMKKDQYEKDYIKHQSTSYRAHLMSMDTLPRHKKLINDYLAFQVDNKTDNKIEGNKEEVLKDNQRFLWHEGDELDTWGSRLAKKYWNRLFKEYILIDLSRYEQNKFGMRWRLEKEVIAGKGQFICASDLCESNSDLRSWEVKFNYVEKGEKRTALVKVRLCPECSNKLNYSYQRKEVTKRVLKRRLVSPAPLDDDVLDRDSISNTNNFVEIRDTIKKARREGSRSLTEDDYCYNNDDDGASSSGTDSSSYGVNKSQIQPITGVTGTATANTLPNPPNIHSSSTIANSGLPLSIGPDSSANSFVSSGPSSPRSLNSLSEDEAVISSLVSSVNASPSLQNLVTLPVPGIANNLALKKSSKILEEDFEKYITDLLL